MKKIEDNNALVFIVDVKANKRILNHCATREALKQVTFKVTVMGVGWGQGFCNRSQDLRKEK